MKGWIEMSDILIALDDGHGMKTPGKETPYMSDLGRKVKENEFNREVVKYLDIELRRCGFKTLLLAPTDEDISLKERTDLANSKKADAYISIHFDALDGSFGGSNPSGHTVFHYPGSSTGKKLAECVYGYLRGGTPQNGRGVKGADFHVLRETDMVAILSENGFMDNWEEAHLMLKVDFQKEVAREHAQGLCKYFEKAYVPEPKPAVISKNGKIYRVQVGAFSSKENADRLVAELKSKGYSAIIV